MKKYIIALLCGIIFSVSSYAESAWKQVQCVVIPQNVTIYEGITKSGNPKYWIEIQNLKVSVSPSSAEKFKKGEVKLELVKWENTETKKLKYSTRQVKEFKPLMSNNIDLTKLFK